MNKHNPIKLTASKDGKTVELDIEGAIGGDYDWFTGELTGITKEAIKAELKEIGSLKVDKIIVNINSYGGDVNHGLSIHDLLAQNPAKKVVRINGMTASAATVIAMAGDEIEMSDNALFLVHRASTMAWGNQSEMKTVLKDLEAIDNLMAKIYSKKTGKSVEEVLGQMDKSVTGEWMSADEAKGFGFVDSTFEPTKMAASFSNEFLSKAGLPSIPNNKTNEMKKETFVASLIAGFSALFNAEKNKDLKEDEVKALINKTINEVAEAEVVKYDAKVAEMQNEFDSKITEAKVLSDESIVALNATISELNEKLAAKEAELVTALGTQQSAKGGNDPSLDGSDGLTPNQRAAKENAKSLGLI